MASFTLEPCGKCHRPIRIPSPVGTIIGANGVPYIAHKACAEPVHAEANPVVVTSREELLGNVLPIEVPPPPVVVSHPAPVVVTQEDIEDAGAPFSDKVIAANPEDPRGHISSTQPSTPVREQQAARRKAPAKKAPAKKVEPKAEEKDGE